MSIARARLATCLVVGASLLMLPASPARAQQTVATPSVGLPQTLVIPLRSGDASGDSAGLPLDLGMMPLRLSLSSGFWPQGKTLPGCAERAEQSGDTWNFFPLQRAGAIHLLPSLTLVGFSTTACAVDANAGVGLVYTAPIRRDLWFVASAGASVLPTTTTTYSPRMRSDARVDLVWKSTPTSALTLGVGRRGVTFGGAF